MKKKTFFFKLTVFVNMLLLLLQVLAMDRLYLGIEIPALTLVTPLLCLVNFIFFIYWFLRLKWPLLLFLVSFALSFDQWQLLYQFKSRGISTSKGLVVMSYNVRSFNRFLWLDQKDVPQAISRYIETTNPDIVCFQEYAEDLAPRFKKYPYKIFKPYLPDGKIGSCVISKQPLFNAKPIIFEASSNGGMQADLVWQRDTIRLYNLHFESLRINATDTLFSSEYSKQFRSKIKRVFDIQKEQVSQFNKLSSLTDFPQVICADLNNNAFSESYKNLSKNRLDTFKEKGSGFGATYDFSFFPLRIDYIFTSTNIKVTDYQTHDVSLSDHKPISVKLEWP